MIKSYNTEKIVSWKLKYSFSAIVVNYGHSCFTIPPLSSLSPPTELFSCESQMYFISYVFKRLNIFKEPINNAIITSFRKPTVIPWYYQITVQCSPFSDTSLPSPPQITCVTQYPNKFNTFHLVDMSLKSLNL